MSARRPHGFAGAKRIVIKIGSVLLVEQATGTIHRTWLNALADDIAGLVRGGSEIILVSSGAIAVGRPRRARPPPRPARSVWPTPIRKPSPVTTSPWPRCC
jgi:glutamate 5-kinase